VKFSFGEVGDVVKAILLIVCMFLAVVTASRCTGQENLQWLTWDDSREGTPPEVNVIESDADSTTFEVILHGFFMETLERETSQGTIEFSRTFLPRDSISNYGTTVHVGDSEIPVVRRYIVVLSNAEEATIGTDGYEIEESSVNTLRGVTVYPLQTPSSEQYPPSEFDFKEKFYRSGVPYPFDYGKPRLLKFDIARFHHLRVAKVEMYPLVYVPRERTLWVYGHFRVTVDHSGGELLEPLPNTLLYDRMYSELLANYDAIRPFLPPTLEGRHGDYLVIVPNKYLMKVLPLASWKRAKGLKVTIKTVPTQIPNTADDIKSAIKDFYDEHSLGDVFVLLVGDVEDVASPACEAYEWNTLTQDCSSDIQYARVAGDDPIPDLFLGRIPADDEEDVERVIEKVLAYEKMSSDGDKEWLGKALLIAHKQDHPGKYTACKESVMSYLYSSSTPTFDTVYGGAGATNSDIKSDLEEGRGIVNYRGYGGADCWWTWGLAGQSWCINADVANLTNGERTPIIFSIASLDNHIRTEDCLGEEFLEQPQGGAVAYYGASADAGSVPNDYLDKNLFKAAFDHELHFLGAVINWAQIRTMEEFSGEGAFSAEYNANIYTLLGDPEMSIRTRRPLTFATVEYPEWVEAGEQSVEVAVKNANGGPIRNALVTVRKYKGTSASPDVEACGFTDNDGKVEFIISPAARGGLSVTVVKQDYVPFDGDKPLRVIHTERDLDAGTFSFSWQVEPGKTYAVYVSEKLGPEADWGVLGISLKKEGLTMTLTDAAAGTVQSRFYRVIAQ